ncbi:pseudouridine synthase [Alkaliphilus crotonatoxidans]
MRLQKFLALGGVASRRGAEALIAEGKVLVNGKVITEMGFQIDPEQDTVTYNNHIVKIEETLIYVLMNKPKGYVTTVQDQFNRRKVTDLVEVPQRIFPVGRLDYHTSGLLLLTNDGELTYRLTHPKFKVEKVYRALVKGQPSAEALRAFERGLKIENYITSPAKINILSKREGNCLVEITLREGRNRQVRKMCDAIGHPVIELKRVKLGKLTLGSLREGQWRLLNREEIQYLKKL